MDSTYHWLAGFAQSAGLLYFVGTFLAICLYALWPSNRARFDEAARTPLRED
ncbi:cbb3-type cytochrome c oxidase subunit 3 [Bosea sp. 2YAB26]|uniref:cbb3-type cytochrome c oxidase subunit 3 n=1 Tax=unclassified Bosea (in: a-proteobacteria) TaxID=2653178 RepID=UPI0004E366F5|nr:MULTISPECIES: cbb3-type cytochrome c oxidase subunit 3 [unclassified Bosea (in: a-proteobacteria)]KFC70473.1 Cytochrome c oxidase subunit CcoQ [Bosea sp. LC85]GAU84528.1 Cbb3-type cytochrome oxidase component [Bosea sp. BIWAKO-01]